jgi:tetratricopeptide (TPR) repeat protein
MRNYDNAIADFTEAIRLDPKSAKVYSSGRADTYEHKGDHDKAIRDSIEAIRLDPNCTSAYNSLGIAYDGYAREMSRADAEAAELLFDRVSKNFDAPPRKLDAVQQQVPFDGSIEDFKAATKKLDRAHKVQLLFDYSAAAFKAAIDIQPDYDFGNNNLGVYYARRGGPGDAKLAEKYFRGALTSNPRYADADNNLAIMLARQGTDLAGKGDFPGAMLKFDESIFVHKKGLEVRNGRASDHNNLCRVYMQKYDLDTKQGNLSSATGALDNALKENEISLQCDPNSLGAWMSRAEIRVKQKNLDEAAKCVHRMAAIDAKAPETLQEQFILAVNCLDLNRPDEAISWLSQILEVNKSLADVYNVRGKAYVKKGTLNCARQDFEQVLRIRPDYPGAQERLKAIRAQLANPKK